MKNFLIVLVVLVLGAGAYYYLVMRQPLDEVAVVAAPLLEAPVPAAEVVLEEAEMSDAEDSYVDEVVYEVVEETEPLPELANSDPWVLDALSELVGAAAVQQHIVTENVVSRLVATIDALSGRQVSPNLLPIEPLESTFEANVDFDPTQEIRNAQGDPVPQFLVDPVNYDRYTPYVELLESMDMNQLVADYQVQQSLFQQAYEELGYPDGDFNARLFETIDMLLAAPDVAEPVRLIKPEAYFLFADPTLEALPAGQKLMIRMGSDNARRVKARLLELRTALQ